MPDSQVGFEYTDQELITLEKYLSAERLAGYYIYARSDKWVGMRLYERNTEISEALYGVIQALEITLRNAMHNVLTAQLGREDWYETFSLQDSERASVDDAKKTVLELPAPVTPGRVVAELTFAFWVRLTAHAYEKVLWEPYFTRIFPLKFRDKRGIIHERLKDLKTLRNRIAHHERITCGKRDPEKDYASILETIGWLSPTMKQWVESTNCFRERFDKRLPKKPKPATTQGA